VHDIVLGATQPSAQFGLLGDASGRKVALDLNQTHTISLFGVQGGGKSYTLGSIVEMACMPIPGVNVLPHPLAAVIFHYSSTLDYRPEFTSMVAANTDDAQVRALHDRYGAQPHALEDVVIPTPAAKVAERAAEYPGMKVLPISFKSSELKAAHWKFLMGAVGSQSMYIRQVGLIMKKLRDELTLAGLRKGIEDSGLSDHLKELALLRLRFAEEYVNDQQDLTSVLRPGRLVIVDLRDELVEKDEALGLFVVLLQMFAEATHDGRQFNKLVVFDEAHKYIDSPDLVAGAGRGRAGDAPQGHQYSGCLTGSTFRSCLAYRTLQPDHSSQVQLAQLAEAHPKGQCCARGSDACEAIGARPRRSVRLEQQGDGRRLYARRRQDAVPSAGHAARWRNQDCREGLGASLTVTLRCGRGN
jgi:hypothetical protein